MDTFINSYPTAIGPLHGNDGRIQSNIGNISSEIGTLIPAGQQQNPLQINKNIVTRQDKNNQIALAITVICALGVVLFAALAIGLSIGTLGIPAGILGLGAIGCGIYLLCQKPDLDHPKTRIQIIHQLSNQTFSNITKQIGRLSITIEDVIHYALLGPIPTVTPKAYTALEYFTTTYEELGKSYSLARQEIQEEYENAIGSARRAKDVAADRADLAREVTQLRVAQAHSNDTPSSYDRLAVMSATTHEVIADLDEATATKTYYITEHAAKQAFQTKKNQIASVYQRSMQELDRQFGILAT